MAGKANFVNDSLLEHFACPICFVYMENKIYICPNGHSVCGSCQTKISKCPICMIKLDSKRNITMEKAAKKFQEVTALGDTIATMEGLKVSLRRTQKLSLGSALPNRAEEQFFQKNCIQCPIPECCYYTEHLMQLKIHLGNFHTDQLNSIKKGPSIRSENLMKITVRFDPFSTQKVCLVTITDAIFVIYITRGSLESRIAFYLNVLTVNDTTSMYKFTYQNSSKFSMFYKEQAKSQEGIEIDSNTLEIVRKNDRVIPQYSITIHIQKVASLHG